MKLVLALLAVAILGFSQPIRRAPAPQAAASWDGTKGDLTLHTWSPIGQTVFTLLCSNPSVSAVRVKVTYTSPTGDLLSTIVRVVAVEQRRQAGSGQVGYATFTIEADQQTLSGLEITELFSGPIISF